MSDLTEDRVREIARDELGAALSQMLNEVLEIWNSPVTPAAVAESVGEPVAEKRPRFKVVKDEP